jgi:hypothetical protein
VSLRLEGLVIYYLVPHTLLPGVQAPFSLRIYCSSPIELQRVPAPSDCSLITSWSGKSGGGRDDATFCDNPQVMRLILMQRPLQPTRRIMQVQLTTEGGEGTTVMALMAFQVTVLEPLSVHIKSWDVSGAGW